jgi:hypothetical protein
MPIVTLNVGGTLFSLHTDTLQQYPDTKLARQIHGGWKANDFIDRDPELFPIIANFYRTHQLQIPHRFHPDTVRDELLYWNIPFEEDKLVAKNNVGQRWMQTSFHDVYEVIRTFFDTLFQSPWFVAQSKHTIEIRWKPPPGHVLLQPMHQDIAVDILKRHFGVRGHWAIAQLPSLGGQYPRSWSRPNMSFPWTWPVLSLSPVQVHSPRGGRKRLRKNTTE